MVSRNVAGLVDTPKGRQGRPSKSLTLDQTVAIIAAAITLPVMEFRPGLKDVRRPAELMYAYIVLSLLAGLRTEEARALRWDHVDLDLDGDPDAAPTVPPHVAVWGAARRPGSRSATARTSRSGPASCGRCAPAAWPGCSWSSPTPTLGCAPRSAQCCSAPHGSDAGCTSCATPCDTSPRDQRDGRRGDADHLRPTRPSPRRRAASRLRDSEDAQPAKRVLDVLPGGAGPAGPGPALALAPNRLARRGSLIGWQPPAVQIIQIRKLAPAPKPNPVAAQIRRSLAAWQRRRSSPWPASPAWSAVTRRAVR